jgi:hypothetical protein
VINSSSVTLLFPSTPYIACFADFTIISCAPPKCGPAGGLKSHLTWTATRAWNLYAKHQLQTPNLNLLLWWMAWLVVNLLS